MTGYLGRPEHPDFWLLSQQALDNDAAADSGQDIGDILGRQLDPDSVFYMATQRAARIMAQARGPAGVALAAAWIDGLMTGIGFQHAKAAAEPGGMRTGSTTVWARIPGDEGTGDST
jgi:hypothetical protein